MSGVTEQLHAAFLRPLQKMLVAHGDVEAKPLDVNLLLPLPPRLRIYMFSLVDGGTQRPTEYKAVLRIRGQPTNVYDSFDHSGDRLAILVAYRADLDVFVIWDASLHHRFTNGTNIQVKETTVLSAAALGRQDQDRRLSRGTRERVIACTSPFLAQALCDRVSWTGVAPAA
jgi:hypothetical protein